MKRWQQVLFHALRLGSAALWMVAALGKLKDPVKFMGGVEQYGLLKNWMVPFVAVSLPGVELALALALLAGVWVKPASHLANALLLLFIAGMGSAMARGLELDCSCFDLLGFAPSVVGWGTVLRDVGLAIPTLVLAFWTAPKAGG